MNQSPPTYIPSLDGIRALAISIVLVSHFGTEIRQFVPGAFGVTLFFFLSGFLITHLLIAEHNRTGRISIHDFYVRRILRLAPALLFFLGAMWFTFWFTTGKTYWPEMSAAVFYMMNYYVMFVALPETPIFGLWSLAVEEHFYLFFPAVFALAWAKTRRFLSTLVAACALILVWRMTLVSLGYGEDRIVHATDTRIDSILFGAILAAIVSTPSYSRALDRVAGWPLFLTGLGIIATSFAYRNPEFRLTLRYTAQGLAMIAVFYSIIYTPSIAPVRRLLELKPVIWIGRISYSLYLWHVAMFDFSQHLFPASAPATQYAAGTALAVLAASFSYYFIEGPFVKLRSRFRNQPRTDGAYATS
jgi:peptidoglycan/LPS O-acetylase OafA/YrhL